MLRPDDFSRSLLVLYAWRKGKDFGGHLASEMIMHVLANRVRLGWGNWMQVLKSAQQYDAVQDQGNEYPELWKPEFTRLLHSVESAFESSAKDLSNGALYYADLAKPISNDWFKEKILGDLQTHRRVADMSSLTFFI